MRRRYTRWFVGTTAFLLTAVAMLNSALDPLGVYQPPWSAALAPYKMHAIDRIPKAEVARSRPLDAVILGDSRVLRGFDPRHPGLRAFGETYNLGVSAGSIYEATRMLDLCLANHPPKLVVWSLAPELVEGDRRERTSFDYEFSRLNPHLNPVLYHAHALWGRDVLRASVDVLKRSRNGRQSVICDGFAPDHHAERDPLGLFCRWLPTTPEPSATMRSPTVRGHSTLGQIARSLEQSQRQGTRVVLLFPPVHAAYLEGLAQTGRWDAYEHGKQQIVALVKRCNHQVAEQPEIVVWDFSAFQGLPAEPPPAPGRPEPMAWYLDPLHFRETLGQIVLDRIFERTEAHADFGVLLTPDNIVSHLAAQRSDRDRYRRHSSDVIHLVSERAGIVR